MKRKISFENDYSEGAHSAIMKRLLETNLEQTTGYGNDDYSKQAKEKIKQACQKEEVDVHFAVGGTQANIIVISSILRTHEGVLSATTGHIEENETGAIEATGHKVLTLETDNGKITAAQVDTYVTAYKNDEGNEHSVKPGMVYISHPTETGTLYTKKELAKLSEVCKKHALPLFVDGARMGYGIQDTSDVALPDFAAYADVFYIGGTKCGALFGEAIVITNKELSVDFRAIIKQKGGLLAKGRLLGIQFDTLFTDNLYKDICQEAISFAKDIADVCKENNIELAYESPTNQQFIIVSTKEAAKLREKYVFETWRVLEDDKEMIRLCTSWATTKENVDALLADLRELRK